MLATVVFFRRPLPGDCQETNNIVTWSVLSGGFCDTPAFWAGAEVGPAFPTNQKPGSLPLSPNTWRASLLSSSAHIHLKTHSSWTNLRKKHHRITCIHIRVRCWWFFWLFVMFTQMGYGSYSYESRYFFVTGQWNPKMTMFCVLVFVFPPHVSVQLLAHGRVQTSRVFCFLSRSADLERPHLLEMAHLPDGRHGYFPQRLPTLSSWVTTCRVQLTLEAFPSETASNRGIATDGHSLPAEHVMPAKQKKCFRLDDVSLNLHFI